uniref:F-box domain-containing protein n=1 Tax=Panagrolaimus sp. PS1159 TaxID=55785 RepID=A0AC35FED1_9BILA
MMEIEIERSQPISVIHDPGTAASHDSINDDKEEEKPKNVFLPIDAVTRIFSFLDADELEIARQVCRTWKDVIDSHRINLPYRDISVLHLSTNCEFVFALFCDNKCYRYTSQKFWSDYDTERREKIRLYLANLPFEYKYKCNTHLMSHAPWVEHQNKSRLHLHRCTVRCINFEDTPISKCAIYNIEKRDLYAKQLFTPPLAFYEKLRDMTMFTNIDTVVFNHYSVNETTGDMLKRWRGTLRVKRVFFHSVNLRAVSAKEFHFLVTEAIVADEYYFAYIHKALPDHFNSDLFFHPTMLRAKTICIGAIFDRTQAKNMVHCNFPEEDLRRFIYRPDEGMLDTFCFNRDNFNHPESLLYRVQTSVFKTVQSKRDNQD